MREGVGLPTHTSAEYEGGWGYQRMQEKNMREGVAEYEGGVGLPMHAGTEYEGRGGATNIHWSRI